MFLSCGFGFGAVEFGPCCVDLVAAGFLGGCSCVGDGVVLGSSCGSGYCESGDGCDGGVGGEPAVVGVGECFPGCYVSGGCLSDY